MGFLLPFKLQAQSTAITYQGRLDGNSGPVNGTYDFTFSLFSVSSGAGQVGSTINRSGTGVTNGLFTVTLDFGNQFSGADRWLEIGVRTNGAPSYATLTPRQPLTSTPHAITALSVSGSVPASSLVGNVPSSSLNSVPAGNLTGTVGDARLSSNVALRSGGNNLTGNQAITGSLQVQDSGANSGRIQVGATAADGTPKVIAFGNGDFVRVGESGNDNTLELTGDRISMTGLVGIGTDSPNAALEIVNPSTADVVATAHNSIAQFIGQHANGTIGSPTAVGFDDDLAWFGARGYNGAFFSGTRAAMILKASQSWTELANGTDLILATTRNGTTSRSERMRIKNDGKVGIGTTEPNANLEIASSSTAEVLATASGSIGIFSGQTANGTPENPTAVVTDQDLAWFGARGHDGEFFSATRAAMIMKASQNWTPSAHGTDLLLATTQNGTTSRSERMRIKNNGFVGIGTAEPNANLEIASSSTAEVLATASGSFGIFAGQTANGSPESPSAVFNGQNLAWFGARGHDGGFFSGTRAAMIMRTTQDWSESAHGTEISLATTANNTTTRSERMRITQDGRVMIGTGNPDATLSVNGSASKSGGGSWTTYSDGRLKDVNLEFQRGLDALAMIQPVQYHYKQGNVLNLPSDKEYVGVVAQQVEKAVPEAIDRTEDGYLTVNNDPILWTMFNAIKELNQKVEEKDTLLRKQDEENAELRARMDRLEQLLSTLTTSSK